MVLRETLIEIRDGHYTYLCAGCTPANRRVRLEKARQERLAILEIINRPGTTWKVRRELLRLKGFDDVLVDEMVGKTEPASDY